MDTTHLPDQVFNSDISNEVYRRKDDADFGYSGSVANSMDSATASDYCQQKVAYRYTRHGKVSRPVSQPPEQWLSKKKERWPQTLIEGSANFVTDIVTKTPGKLGKQQWTLKGVRKTYRKWRNNNFDMIVCVLYSLQCVVGWAYHSQVSLGWMVFLAALLYFEENMRFVLQHFSFHTGFWEFQNLSEMDVPTAAACRHHNGEPWIYMTKWADYRLYFFFEREKWYHTLGWKALLHPNAVQGRHNLRSLVVWYMCGWEVMWCHRAWMIFNAAMQQIAHEWYHTPRNYRAKQFVITYPFLQGMEMCGIMDTTHHKRHHKSDGTDEHHTEQFFDMAMPPFFEVLASKIYQWLMKDEMTAYQNSLKIQWYGYAVLHTTCLAFAGAFAAMA